MVISGKQKTILELSRLKGIAQSSQHIINRNHIVQFNREGFVMLMDELITALLSDKNE